MKLGKLREFSITLLAAIKKIQSHYEAEFKEDDCSILLAVVITVLYETLLSVKCRK